MEDKSRSKTTTIMFAIFILALIIGFIGVIIAVINIFNPKLLNFSANSSQPTSIAEQLKQAQPVYKSTNTAINYDFTLKTVIALNNYESETSELVQQITQLSSETDLTGTNLARIRVPEIKIDAPIVEGLDGEVALDSGFWLYTPSYKDAGEKIFLCHRRYWGANHPYSCWFLDKLVIGSQIMLDTKEGKTLTYEVMSTSTVDDDELPRIARLSTDNVIKIITCAPLGASTHRLVVIARLVS